jgi:hypothetical protein
MRAALVINSTKICNSDGTIARWPQRQAELKRILDDADPGYRR